MSVPHNIVLDVNDVMYVMGGYHEPLKSHMKAIFPFLNANADARITSLVLNAMKLNPHNNYGLMFI